MSEKPNDDNSAEQTAESIPTLSVLLAHEAAILARIWLTGMALNAVLTPYCGIAEVKEWIQQGGYFAEKDADGIPYAKDDEQLDLQTIGQMAVEVADSAIAALGLEGEG